MRDEGVNKIGLTSAQQKKLENCIRMSQIAASIVTDMHQPQLRPEELRKTVMDLVEFAKDAYPSGPRSLAAELNDISQFCDLTIVTVPRDMDSGKPL